MQSLLYKQVAEQTWADCTCVRWQASSCLMHAESAEPSSILLEQQCFSDSSQALQRLFFVLHCVHISC